MHNWNSTYSFITFVLSDLIIIWVTSLFPLKLRGQISSVVRMFIDITCYLDARALLMLNRCIFRLKVDLGTLLDTGSTTLRSFVSNVGEGSKKYAEKGSCRTKFSSIYLKLLVPPPFSLAGTSFADTSFPGMSIYKHTKIEHNTYILLIWGTN